MNYLHEMLTSIFPCSTAGCKLVLTQPVFDVLICISYIHVYDLYRTCQALQAILTLIDYVIYYRQIQT